MELELACCAFGEETLVKGNGCGFEFRLSQEFSSSASPTVPFAKMFFIQFSSKNYVQKFDLSDNILGRQ